MEQSGEGSGSVEPLHVKSWWVPSGVESYDAIVEESLPTQYRSNRKLI